MQIQQLCSFHLHLIARYYQRRPDLCKKLIYFQLSFYSCMVIHQIEIGSHSVSARVDYKMFCQYRSLGYMACVVLRKTLACELGFFFKYLTHCAFSVLNIFIFSV